MRVINCWELQIDPYGDWGSSYSHHKYFSTAEKAKAYEEEYYKKNKYRPLFRLLRKRIEIL